MVEIRWHARGGQGAITGSELLAEAALEDGLYFQAFPEFGAERTGAPIVAYTRLSTSPILLHSAVAEPSIVVVLDSTLLAVIDVTRGLQSGGLVLINSPLTAAGIRPKLPKGSFRLATVPASRIALETLGKNIPNTVLVGALLRLLPVVRPETCMARMRIRLAQRLSAKVVEQNVLAFQRGEAEVKEG